MHERWKRLLDEETRITSENVQELGEVIGLVEISTVMDKGGHNLYWLCNGLYRDMNRQPGFQDHYSEGYDIAQEAIAFLCEHIGERLGDPYVTRLGKTITVERACFRYVDRYLDKQYIRHYNRSVVLDEKIESDPSAVFYEELENREKDYRSVDVLIEKMHLKPKELDTLNAYMAGMKFMEITRFMNVDHTTIWRRMQNVRKKYLLAKGVL